MLATACAHTGASLWKKNTRSMWELLCIYSSVVDTSNGNINCITASTATIINTMTMTTITSTTITTTNNKNNHNRNNRGEVLVTNHANLLEKICIVTLLVPLTSTGILGCLCILKTASFVERAYWKKIWILFFSAALVWTTSPSDQHFASYAPDMHLNASRPSWKEPVTIIRLLTKLKDVMSTHLSSSSQFKMSQKPLLGFSIYKRNANNDKVNLVFTTFRCESAETDLLIHSTLVVIHILHLTCSPVQNIGRGGACDKYVESNWP